jgi:hypothetical protein
MTIRKRGPNFRVTIELGASSMRELKLACVVKNARQQKQKRKNPNDWLWSMTRPWSIEDLVVVAALQEAQTSRRHDAEEFRALSHAWFQR